MQKGTDLIKKAIGVGMAVAQGINNALADDNKISFWEGLGLAGKVFPIAEVINSRKDLIDELKDLDEAEKMELVEWAKKQYSIPNEKAEITVIKALQLFVNVLDFSMEMVEIWRENDKKKETVKWLLSAFKKTF